MKLTAKHIIGFILIAGHLMVSANLFAQKNEAEQLSRKRKKLEAEIAYTNQLLKEVTKSKKHTLYELKLLSNRINKRNELIATLKREIYLLDIKIGQLDNTVDKLNEDIADLKKEYARIAYYLYRNNSAYNKLIYLFSAEDLNQAYQRLRYMEQLSFYVRKKAEQLKEKEAEKTKQSEQLKKEKLSKTKLLEQQSTEIALLEMEQKDKARIKQNLSGKEQKLRARLRAKQMEARKLTRQIENTISSETKTVVKKGRKVNYALTPEEAKLSKSFVAGKGHLPWPVVRGVISSTYGVHKHPVLKHVQIKNNGVDIATSAGSDARAVFRGKVVRIVKISNTNQAVIVKHGEYFTVYSNLEEIFVKRGDIVEAKQALGKIHTNLQGNTELHFEVWKGKTLQNPAYWLTKK